MERIIKNFTYKDNSREISSFINENYPGTRLVFDKNKKELVIIHKDAKKCNTVYNVLNIINRFDLKVKKDE